MNRKSRKIAIKKMGKKPVNPIGTCFDSTLKQLFLADMPADTKLCHAIITTNMPGQKSIKSGHAWLEFIHTSGIKVALDTIWMIVLPADNYREQLKVEYIIEYSKEEAHNNWLKSDFDNAWDEKIKAHSKYSPDREMN